jgi:tRNA (guanosine-2'-O-)-methyltransferase
MTPERIAKIRRVLRARQPDLTVVTDSVHKGRNLSAIMRNCDAVGIDEMHIALDQRSYRAFRGTAMGSQQWLQITRHDTVVEALMALKADGFQVVAADLSETAVCYRELDYTLPTAILMGAEKHGVSEQAKAMADHLVYLPMAGMVQSYNVSVAAGILLEEARHQRELAGLYQQQRISQQAFDRRFFEWGYPKLAAYCQQHGLDYPPVNDAGDLEQPASWYQQIREEGFAD